MGTPFIFGKIVTAKNFTDCEKETADLVQNFTSFINILLSLLPARERARSNEVSIDFDWEEGKRNPDEVFRALYH